MHYGAVDWIGDSSQPEFDELILLRPTYPCPREIETQALLSLVWAWENI